MMTSVRPVGDLLREWRARRRNWILTGRIAAFMLLGVIPDVLRIPVAVAVLT